METTAIILLSIALVLGFMAFRVSWNLEWHWLVGLILAAMPLGLTLLFGIFGLLGSAVFAGGLYKASAGGV